MMCTTGTPVPLSFVSEGIPVRSTVRCSVSGDDEEVPPIGGTFIAEMPPVAPFTRVHILYVSTFKKLKSVSCEYDRLNG